MPLRLDAEFELPLWETTSRAFLEGDLAPALVDTCNELADLAVDALVEAQAAEFDRPTPFTQNAWKIEEARPVAGRDPYATVYAQPIQAEYLVYAIAGGVRRGGDVATTPLGPLVPGRDAPLDAYGNLPRNFVSQALNDPNVAWVTLTPGKPPALIRHAPGRDVEILALIVERAVHRPRLNVYDIVGETLEAEADAVFARHIST